MLRIKIFNVKKNKDLKIGNLKCIKSGYNYDIVKDIDTCVYFFYLKNIFVIHLDKLLLSDFEELYNNSEYKFKVYSTKNIFHVFCISKKSIEINELIFLFGNESNEKYLLLYKKLKKNIIICNRKYDEIQSTYKFEKEIGNGKVIDVLNNELNGMIMMVNYMLKSLPIHYLNIP